jgi:hypothetical protein
MKIKNQSIMLNLRILGEIDGSSPFVLSRIIDH